MFEIEIWIFMAAIFFVLLGSQIYFFRQQRRAWEEAGETLGLQLVDPGMFLTGLELSGTYRDRSVRVRYHAKKNGLANIGGRNYGTDISAELQSGCWLGVTLAPHGLGDSVTTMFGGEDVETGDEDFDSDFRLQGVVEEGERKVFCDDRVQEKLYELARNDGMKIEGGELQIEIGRRLTEAEELTWRIERVVEAAEVLDEVARQKERESIESDTSADRPEEPDTGVEAGDSVETKRTDDGGVVDGGSESRPERPIWESAEPW